MQTPENLIENALKKRAALLNHDTNALRLIDGYGDGAPDLFLDTLANRWIVSTTTKELSEEWRNALSNYGKTLYWKTLDQHQKDSPIHLSGPEETEPFLVKASTLATHKESSSISVKTANSSPTSPSLTTASSTPLPTPAPSQSPPLREEPPPPP